MPSAWALAKAADHLFGDNFPSGAEVHIDRLAVLLDTVKAEAIAGVDDWRDKKDEWTDAIDSAHPTRSGSHAEYATAMKMVGNRHSKGELVDLVNWLLVRLKAEENV